MPNQTIPEQLFGESDDQERRGERDDAERSDARDQGSRLLASSFPRVDPEQRHVREAVHQDVRHRELKVRVCPDDTHVPGEHRRCDDQVLAPRDGLLFQTLVNSSGNIG